MARMKTEWSNAALQSWSDAPARWLPNNPIIQQSITPFLAALGSLLGIEGPQDTCLRRELRGYGRQATDLTTSKPTLAGVDQTGGVVELDFDKSISDRVNMDPERFRGYANSEGFRGDFVFLARDTASPY